MPSKHTQQHLDNRALAQEQGHKTYYGPTCKWQHDGRRWTSNTVCVTCAQIKSRTRYREMDPTQKQKYSQTQNQRQSNDPRYRMYHAAKHRACTKGLDFDIELADISVPDICPVLGIPMTSPSLDRFDNQKGYTKDNIRVISTRANNLKNDASIEELEKVLDYMKRGG